MNPILIPFNPEHATGIQPTTPRQYHLFAGRDSNGAGAMHDYEGSFATYHAATDYHSKKLAERGAVTGDASTFMRDEYAHVARINSTTGDLKLIAKWRPNEGWYLEPSAVKKGNE